MFFDDVSSIELAKQFGFHSKHINNLVKFSQRMILAIRDNYVFEAIIDYNNIFITFEFNDFVS